MLGNEVHWDKSVNWKMKDARLSIHFRSALFPTSPSSAAEAASNPLCFLPESRWSRLKASPTGQTLRSPSPCSPLAGTRILPDPRIPTGDPTKVEHLSSTIEFPEVNRGRMGGMPVRGGLIRGFVDERKKKSLFYGNELSHEAFFGISEAQFFADVFSVPVDRIPGDAKTGSDIQIVQALPDHAGHPRLLRAQTGKFRGQVTKKGLTDFRRERFLTGFWIKGRGLPNRQERINRPVQSVQLGRFFI